VSLQLPECLLFDLDGTVLDSLPGIESSLYAAFSACGLEMRRSDVRAEIGPPVRIILKRLAGDIEEAKLGALESAFRTAYDTEGWRQTYCYAAAPEVLRSLRERGHRLFVVSNKPRHIALQILEKENVLELFQQILTRDGRTPPYLGKAEMIATLLAQERLKSSAFMMIGDTIEDAEAACAHNLRFVLMMHGYGDVPADGRIPVAARLKGFEDFLPLIQKEDCDR
jgi:phosphoglycolate phosphatase